VLVVLAIVDLFCRGPIYIMNSIEGSQIIPTFVEIKNTLNCGSRHTFDYLLRRYERAKSDKASHPGLHYTLI
jgi:hypothetical protein